MSPCLFKVTWLSEPNPTIVVNTCPTDSSAKIENFEYDPFQKVRVAPVVSLESKLPWLRSCTSDPAELDPPPIEVDMIFRRGEGSCFFRV